MAGLRQIGHPIHLKTSISQLSKNQIQNKILDPLWQHGTICLKNQNLDVPELKNLAESLGKTHILPKNFTFGNNGEKTPEVIKIGNINPDGSIKKGFKGAEYWHHDGDFFNYPENQVINILHTKIIPNQGGQTGFLDTTSPLINNVFSQTELKKLKRSTLLVSVKNIADFEIQNENDVIPDVVHPVVNIHPFSGFQYLYLPFSPCGLYDTVEKKHWISNQEIIDKIINAGYMYQHQWEEGDVLIWDNLTMMHRSMGGYLDSARLLLRIQSKYTNLEAQ
ncbi:hypothetical protein PPERSA_02268 [Pseudocohnilembus persalinus]|uniref:TauD/TfdA-like domain-containing protein n=1 Tax=Pseudocohnilembus persalinus TaxID=266149 RepID=A0A0V0QKU9_PSEPJ|nr:hypothetical protein PPERSA_02268 [Pseudocohnilembus persalinus]|eukprot:KRX02778.1 hypothetical protein PPERSA_02268 [Pseudocohnilembus persalinus]